LLRAGYNFVQYSSHERIVESNKDQYYLSLRNAQKELPEQNAFSVIWAEFFLEMTQKAKRCALQKDQTGKNLRIRSPSWFVISSHWLENMGRSRLSFLVKSLSVNRNTIKKHVQELRRTGRLVLHGRGWGTFYTLP